MDGEFCPPLSSSPHANSFTIGTAVINTQMLKKFKRIDGHCDAEKHIPHHFFAAGGESRSGHCYEDSESDSDTLASGERPFLGAH